MLRALSLLPWVLVPAAAFPASPPSTAQAEVRYLLDYLEHSGCEFYRNGSWHSAADARSHLERKYNYLLRNGLVANAEDFIERAASASSMSGKPYRVRCARMAPVPSAQWLSDELRRYRAARGERN